MDLVHRLQHGAPGSWMLMGVTRSGGQIQAAQMEDKQYDTTEKDKYIWINPISFTILNPDVKQGGHMPEETDIHNLPPTPEPKEKRYQRRIGILNPPLPVEYVNRVSIK